MLETIKTLAPALIGFMGTMVGALVVTVGWFMSHKLPLLREIEAKRREQHLNYLVQAYRTLSKVKPYNEMGTLSSLNVELQQTLADIQFLGDSTQVAYAQKFAEALGSVYS